MLPIFFGAKMRKTAELLIFIDNFRIIIHHTESD